MFDVVLDRRLQVVDRRRDRLRLLGEAQRTELLRVPLVPPGHRVTSCRNPLSISASEAIDPRWRVVLVAASLSRASHSAALLTTGEALLGGSFPSSTRFGSRSGSRSTPARPSPAREPTGRLGPAGPAGLRPAPSARPTGFAAGPSGAGPDDRDHRDRHRPMTPPAHWRPASRAVRRSKPERHGAAITGRPWNRRRLNPSRRIRDDPRRPIGRPPGVPCPPIRPSTPPISAGPTPARRLPGGIPMAHPARSGPIRASALRGRIRPVPPAHSLAGLPRPGTDHPPHFDRRGPIPEKDPTTDCTDFTDRGQNPKAGALGARGPLDPAKSIAALGEPSDPPRRAGGPVRCVFTRPIAPGWPTPRLDGFGPGPERGGRPSRAGARPPS